MQRRPNPDESPCENARACPEQDRCDAQPFDRHCVRYTEYAVALHGALIFGTPSLRAALRRFECDAPLVCGKASWGYDADAGRGWFQLAADATEEEYEAGAAAFDYDMRHRGLVAVAPPFS